jgi:two-component system, OmpR family, sensor histidine kinase BaeS
MSLRLRLILSFSFIVLVTVVTLVTLAGIGAASQLRAFMFRGGMAGIENLVEALEEHYRTQGTWEGSENLFLNQGHGHRRGAGMGGILNQRLRLGNADGEVLVDTGNPSPGGRMTDLELRSAIPLQVAGKTVGYLLAEGGMLINPNTETALLARLNRAGLVAGLIAGGLSLVLALLLAYSLIRPVRALTNAASNLAGGDLSQRVPTSGDDELAELGKTFNYLAATLEKSEASRKAMTADIAHELRTPLSVQQAHLEALQDGIYPLTSDHLIPILEQNKLLIRLVEDLNTLALADAGQLDLQPTLTDLNPLIQQVADRFRPQAASRRIEINTPHPPEESPLPSVSLDAQRVEQILSNLLGNALRFTPDGGKIAIECRRSVATISLNIRDNGPGIPPDALPNIFERFYRADRSRSREEGGSGLGLSIARRLAEAHGGTLTAANHPAGGAIFTLTLPGK